MSASLGKPGGTGRAQLLPFPPSARTSIEGALALFLDEMGFYRVFLGEIVQPEIRVTQEAMEKHMLLEALAVKVHASWEVFAKDIMIDCLSCDTSEYAKSMEVDVPLQPSRDVCELMLAGTGVLSLGDASGLRSSASKQLAPAFNPFKEIGAADVRAMNEFQKIRNHIAHQSGQSRRGLNAVYRHYKIDPSTRPGNFLATPVKIPRLTEEITRLGIYLNAFLQASQKMEGHLFPEKVPQDTRR